MGSCNGRVLDGVSGLPGRTGNQGEAQPEERGPGKELPSGAGVKLRCSFHSGGRPREVTSAIAFGGPGRSDLTGTCVAQ